MSRHDNIDAFRDAMEKAGPENGGRKKRSLISFLKGNFSMKETKHIVAIVAARMTSSRLPGKILKPILGRPALELMIERVRRVPGLNDIVIATTINSTDDCVVDLAKKLGVQYFRGSELDVLSRIVGAGQDFKADVIVEITSDCIVIDPAAVQQCIDAYLEGGSDYVGNGIVRTYPVGMDVHVFSTALLAESERLAKTAEEHEHVGLYIYRRPEQYRLRCVRAVPNATWPDLHLTLDTQEDYLMLKALYEGLYPQNPTFNTADIIDFLKHHPEIVQINQQVRRNKSQSEYFAEIKEGKH